MTREWQFDEESEDVDLNRIYVEISSIPAVHAFSYMEHLRLYAPIVYSRLKKFATEKKVMTWWNWDYTGYDATEDK